MVGKALTRTVSSYLPFKITFGLREYNFSFKLYYKIDSNPNCPGFPGRCRFFRQSVSGPKMTSDSGSK